MFKNIPVVERLLLSLLQRLTQQDIFVVHRSIHTDEGIQHLSDEAKHTVEVKQAEKPLKASKESLQSLKGVAGGKQIARMKKEAVDCPVMAKTVCFVECFACKNFLRRLKGTAHCKGDALP